MSHHSHLNFSLKARNTVGVKLVVVVVSVVGVGVKLMSVNSVFQDFFR